VRVLRAHGGLDLESEVLAALDTSTLTPWPVVAMASTGDKRSQL